MHQIHDALAILIEALQDSQRQQRTGSGLNDVISIQRDDTFSATRRRGRHLQHLQSAH